MIVGSERVADAVEAVGEDRSDNIEADINIISDPNGPVYNRTGEGNITIHVKNSGNQVLNPYANLIDVLVDGSYVSDVQVTPLDSSFWRLDEVVRIDIAVPDLGTGDHRVKVIVNKKADVFRFRIV